MLSISQTAATGPWGEAEQSCRARCSRLAPHGPRRVGAAPPRPQPPPVQAQPSDPRSDPQTSDPQTPVLKPPCYPSTRTGPGVQQSGARSMPRTTETRCHLPASLASLWTTSEETTMLWVLSISDGAGHRPRVRKLGCNDHTWDPAQSWTADGQSPSTTGGVGGAGKAARGRCGHRQQGPLGSQCDGQGGLESAGIPTQFLGRPKGAVHTHHLAPLSLLTALWLPTHLKPQSL